jgi:hypothetical protein
VHEHNIYDFHVSGNLSLVRRDLAAVVPNAKLPTSFLASVEEAVADAGLENAWHVRRELINFKKLCLHLFEDARSTEKVSFFHAVKPRC